MFGLLALFVLLALLAWKFLAAENPPPSVVRMAAANSGAVAQSMQHSVIVSAPKSVVEPPTLPPVKASESPSAALSDSDPSVNDWGEVEFTDGVPVVRTLATGETCIIVPTVITPNEFGGGGLHFDLVIESPGSMPAIEGLRGKDAINAELSSARMDSNKKILSNPSIITPPGQEVGIGIGSPGDPLHFSIRFKPKVSSQ
jgi:hypothetical protein